MLTAEEAYKKSLDNLEKIETIDQLLIMETRIKESIEKGYLAAFSDPLSINLAEKLGIELEEFGYATNVSYCNMVNEAKEGLFRVEVNWRYIPRPSRVEIAPSFN